MALRSEIGFDPLSLSTSHAPKAQAPGLDLFWRVFQVTFSNAPAKAGARSPRSSRAAVWPARSPHGSLSTPTHRARTRSTHHEYFHLHPQDPGVDPQYPDC